MLSGVGPKEHLRELGINNLVNLPVGHNLQDHVTFSGNAFIVNASGLCVNDVSEVCAIDHDDLFHISSLRRWLIHYCRRHENPLNVSLPLHFRSQLFPMPIT